MALNLAEDWLTRYPDLDIIVSENNDMALATVEAVDRLNWITVVSINAIKDGLQSVIDGKFACTVFQDSKGQCATHVDCALKLCEGQKVDKEVMIPFQLVTKDNVKKFI